MQDARSTRTIRLNKGGHRYVLRYGPGCEDQIVDEIMRMADDSGNNLDWLDAAALSFQVTHTTAADCFESLSPEDLI